MTRTFSFDPTRAAALARLKAFLPHAGRDYAALRNHDLPEKGHPHVSGLSPYIRHRLLTEEEVLTSVLGRFSMTSAEKFIQEVLWRSYWKGWLELRPGVWADYRRGLDAALDEMRKTPDLAVAVDRAKAGETGIAAFDGWMTELAETGYLHNHARMWAASIWIFTLRLPWEIGADHFLRHLLDGDPASNTLGWRWVAGLQTQGKHYLARASNIRKYTDRDLSEGLGRLVSEAAPLRGAPNPARRDPPAGAVPHQGLRTGLLLTEEDVSPGFVLDTLDTAPMAHASLISVDGRSPGGVSDGVKAFTAGAVSDARTRWAPRMGAGGPDATRPEEIADWAQSAGLEQVVTAYAPIGPAARALGRLDALLHERGIEMIRVLRDFDAAAWPHATHGFFRFKDHIPGIVAQLKP